MHLLTVIGARPQIIKAAAVSRAIAGGYADQVTEHILHTGQHYDTNMSQVFFDELGIPQPEYNLGVGSGPHGQQTAKMIAGIEEVLTSRTFDGIILYGDTNSTLAGAVAASKLHVPIFHIEAGLRSYNRAMPEEINRIVTDQLSTLLFAPTQTAVDNLREEGFFAEHPTLHRCVINCGDVMYDNSLHFARVAAQRCDILQCLRLQPEGYILATIHRDNNTDNPQRLEQILRALVDIAQKDNIPVVLPLHPRTRARLSSDQLATLNSKLILQEPFSFLEMTLMEQNARLVVTDSGGVQKEAFFFGRPCIILRPETEWVEIVQHHAGIIADADYGRIIDAYAQFSALDTRLPFPPLFGDGHAAEKIIQNILSWQS